MKILKIFILFGILLILSSCAATFYQVYNVKPTDNSIKKDNGLIYEDENCKLTYDLWSDGGNIGFNFYNKTDNMIYLKLNKSFFIFNGYANDYFKDRTYTTSENISASSSVSLSNYSTNIKNIRGSEVSIKEDSIVYIPPKTTKIIYEYSITNNLYKSCDLFKYPTANNIKTLSYLTKEESPFVFSNIITYEVNGKIIKIKNDFFVCNITNYPENKFLEVKYDFICGKKSNNPVKIPKYKDVDNFYIKYPKNDLNKY